MLQVHNNACLQQCMLASVGMLTDLHPHNFQESKQDHSLLRLLLLPLQLPQRRPCILHESSICLLSRLPALVVAAGGVDALHCQVLQPRALLPQVEPLALTSVRRLPQLLPASQSEHKIVSCISFAACREEFQFETFMLHGAAQGRERHDRADCCRCCAHLLVTGSGTGLDSSHKVRHTQRLLQHCWHLLDAHDLRNTQSPVTSLLLCRTCF